MYIWIPKINSWRYPLWKLDVQFCTYFLRWTPQRAALGPPRAGSWAGSWARMQVAPGWSAPWADAPWARGWRGSRRRGPAWAGGRPGGGRGRRWWAGRGPSQGGSRAERQSSRVAEPVGGRSRLGVVAGEVRTRNRKIVRTGEWSRRKKVFESRSWWF